MQPGVRVGGGLRLREGNSLFECCEGLQTSSTKDLCTSSAQAQMVSLPPADDAEQTKISSFLYFFTPPSLVRPSLQPHPVVVLLGGKCDS